MRLPLKCEFCSKSFEGQEALGRRLRKKHKNKLRLAIFEHPLGSKAKLSNTEQLNVGCH